MIELLIVIAVISVVAGMGVPILFESYRSAIFLSVLHGVINKISESRNISMIAPSSVDSLHLDDASSSIYVSGLENIHFMPLTGLPQSAATITVSDDSHGATITINTEGGISF